MREAARKEQVVDNVLEADGGEAREVVEMEGKGGVRWNPRSGRLDEHAERRACDAD
jgi:hypothetical protein